ncbi:VTT domain-containing protein [Loigolactobacillus jiayinensis]|uniref:VTT domain-containing protein n=1 Tax=Loigolactobacillus jiayinensis TaxID=2486016 RepID=A0ABW1RB90_9LACO|nr:VTT domain-containing protein [Loigolactobacillus jiayinensis]
MLHTIFYGLTHLETVLLPIFQYFGRGSYAILFLLIFAETGLVIFPFLPGESIIFISSTLAARHGFFLDIGWLSLTFFLAALLGDTVNFEIGRHLGHWKFFNRHIQADKLERATDFFVRHGGKTVIFGRFIPMIRTFVPLIAGMFKMNWPRFVLYNFLGVLIWVGTGSLLGYFLGAQPFVQAHFSMILLGIILVALLPSLSIGLYNLIKNKQ